MILDTNALSALADGRDGIMEALEACPVLAVPVIVIGEYAYGISASRHRHRYEQWLNGFLLECRVLEIDRTTASTYAGIRAELKQAGRPIPSNDAWIAALSRQHDVPVVSRDAHFDAVAGLQRVSW